MGYRLFWKFGQFQTKATSSGLLFYYLGDSRIISGESGAVTLGALHHICTKNEAMRKQLELDETSRILLVSTEGDTDPDGFRQIVLQEGQWTSLEFAKTFNYWRIDWLDNGVNVSKDVISNDYVWKFFQYFLCLYFCNTLY